MRRRRLIELAVAAPSGAALAGFPVAAVADDDSIVDLAVNGLTLLSPAETAPVLSAADGAVVQTETSTVFRFSNADASQTLTLTVHPGSEQFSVAVASVGYVREGDTGPVLAGSPEEFVTQKGIRLGLRRAEVEAVLGEPAYLVGDTAVYELSGDSAMLRRFNMPIYRATYAYEIDRLIGFRFGFPYP